ncbi:Uncharacterized protein FWK35_00010188 [Aphis craccivora]|uniref:RNase H domain-containing protein n=1 Tax=Aphis craccivora TaxID=307492 RepID=A0A6G0Z8H0_APHCR|nr:Uncharacterized protein FWK35_00010188 [Aphis craccivora]
MFNCCLQHPVLRNIAYMDDASFYVSKKQAFSFAAEILIRSYLVAGIVLESHTSCVSSSQIRVSFYMTLQSEMSLSSVMTVYIEVTVISTRQPDHISRRQDIAITRIRIGHTLATHSFLINKDDPPICNTCQFCITIKHILEKCPIYEPTCTSLNLPHNIKEILDEGQTSNIIKFITKCNLINKL